MSFLIVHSVFILSALV